MIRGSLSNSQALRVIGQRLANLGIHVFELKKIGERYAVRIEPVPAKGQLPNGNRAIQFISPTTLPTGSSEGFPLVLEFTPAELRWCDDQNKLNRVRPTALPVVGSLSLMLRVLGDFVDRKAPDEFTILWSRHAVKLSYGAVEHNFSAPNIYDLGMVMYLKRSSTRPDESDAPFVTEQRTTRPSYGIQALASSYK